MNRQTLFRTGLCVVAGVLAIGKSLRAQEQSVSIKSPDGKLTAEFRMQADAATYSVRLNDQTVLQDSRLGLVRDDADFSKGLKLLSHSAPEAVEDRYEILNAKRRLNEYRANREVFHLETTGGKKLDIIFQVSNDGVAFRYAFPEHSQEIRKIKEEATTFHLPANTTCWLQPMQKAKTGFRNSNPAYEEFYQMGIPAATRSPVTASTGGLGWIYPALFRAGGEGGGDNWVLLTEAGLGRNYCATHLRDDAPDGEYGIALADPREIKDNGPATPESTLPWVTPWRVIAVGSLKTIMESTLGTDLADPAKTPPTDPTVRPGKSSWSWALLGSSQTTYDTQKRFIDYSADMQWQYCLIDGEWDKTIGYDKVKDLADYAATKKVSVLVWYDSAGDWNTVAGSPKDRLLTHASRIAEFDRLKAMGVQGMKVDFFGGDGQSMIAYYHDILDDAAPYGFMMNFHGTTLPRGWERTYPHLMTMEAVKGFEYTRGTQAAADQEPSHAAMLPFARNVFDPMDFTPVCLDRIIGRVQRKTTSGFELALSVVFASGIQHYVEIPEGMARMPGYVKDFLRHVPSIWDDTKFVDGFPGKLVVMARKGEGRWYVAGINGEAVEKHLTVDLGAVPLKGAGNMIADGTGTDLFVSTPVNLTAGKKLDVIVKPYGGFVIAFPGN